MTGKKGNPLPPTKIPLEMQVSKLLKANFLGVTEPMEVVANAIDIRVRPHGDLEQRTNDQPFFLVVVKYGWWQPEIEDAPSL